MWGNKDIIIILCYAGMVFATMDIIVKLAAH